jgi:hypothetical protein
MAAMRFHVDATRAPFANIRAAHEPRSRARTPFRLPPAIGLAGITDFIGRPGAKHVPVEPGGSLIHRLGFLYQSSVQFKPISG